MEENQQDIPDFLSLVDMKRLRECFSEGTGRGVKIGLLDSGVSCQLPVLEGSVKGNYEIEIDGPNGRVVEVPLGEDTIAHGTACASILHQYAPEAELYSMQVIGQSHSAPTEKLVTAFEFAIEQGWDILNLSLGNESPDPRLLELADRAFYNGTLVIAAKDNKPDKIGYPAASASVLAVDMDHFSSPLDFRYLQGAAVEIEAHGVYIDCPLPDGSMQSYTGSSFACPHVSAIAARLRQYFPKLNLSQLRVALQALGSPQMRES